jgi:hypothetical protein
MGVRTCNTSGFMRLENKHGFYSLPMQSWKHPKIEQLRYLEFGKN